ncbi:hypothetical protein NXS19_010176 [Fusarium pseudograminearum]|nr:hypothetical protein NXS19_010176 [Fusarium pseudograminearum]
MEDTIKPVRNRGGNRRAQTIFQDIRQHSEQDMSSQGQTDSASEASFHGVPMATPDYMNMNNFNNEFLKIENGFGRQDIQGLDVGPSTPHMEHFIDLRPYSISAQSISGTPSQTPSRRHSPHRRTESVASIASAASIASINIEETKTETGVTQDEIAQFISGPDAGDGKWTCTYEDCGKKFGRKENTSSRTFRLTSTTVNTNVPHAKSASLGSTTLSDMPRSTPESSLIPVNAATASLATTLSLDTVSEACVLALSTMSCARLSSEDDPQEGPS